MKSESGLDLLKLREGTLLTMYRDSAGLPSIGTGHLLTKDELSSGKILLRVYWHHGITAEESDEQLALDLAAAEKAVGVVKVPLNPYQHDTLVSFVFNVGVTAFKNSRLLRLLNSGDYASVPEQLKRWKYSAGRVDKVLVNRRKSEIKQWLTPT